MLECLSGGHNYFGFGRSRTRFLVRRPYAVIRPFLGCTYTQNCIKSPVSYMCGTEFPTARKWRRLRVCEIRLLRGSLRQEATGDCIEARQIFEWSNHGGWKGWSIGCQWRAVVNTVMNPGGPIKRREFVAQFSRTWRWCMTSELINFMDFSIHRLTSWTGDNFGCSLLFTIDSLVLLPLHSNEHSTYLSPCKALSVRGTPVKTWWVCAGNSSMCFS